MKQKGWTDLGRSRWGSRNGSVAKGVLEDLKAYVQMLWVLAAFPGCNSEQAQEPHLNLLL